MNNLTLYSAQQVPASYAKRDRAAVLEQGQHGEEFYLLPPCPLATRLLATARSAKAIAAAAAGRLPSDVPESTMLMAVVHRKVLFPVMPDPPLTCRCNSLPTPYAVLLAWHLLPSRARYCQGACQACYRIRCCVSTAGVSASAGFVDISEASNKQQRGSEVICPGQQLRAIVHRPASDPQEHTNQSAAGGNRHRCRTRCAGRSCSPGEMR